MELQLSQAQQAVRDLEEKLLSLEQADPDDAGEKKEIRIWVDGAFDMMHYGHMNAFRQAHALGTYLIAGVNSSETIAACKGPPVCNDEERVETVRGCKWVDEVVEGVPYVMTEDYLLDVVQRYRIDYVVHGDDPCIVNGRNAYEAAIKLGKYLTIPRTEGVSTTDIVGRMLLLTSSHHEASPGEPVTTSSLRGDAPAASRSNFLTTSRIMRLFSAGTRPPKPEDRVVYLSGSWDMFHAGHIDVLRQARALGDYLIVGVYGDPLVNKLQGLNLPIMTLHERVLSVLGCRHVDDVLIDAPLKITPEMIASLNIAVVVQAYPANSPPPAVKEGEEDPLLVPRERGLLRDVTTTHSLSAWHLVERIQQQRDRFAERFIRKAQQEADFYKAKYSL